MNNDEMRVAIAEACGWTDVRVNPFAPNPPLCGFNNTAGKTKVANCGAPWGIPDFCADLNAMHEAEAVLTKEQFLVYAWQDCLGEHYADCLHATAAQRAEAFLRTLNLWQASVPERSNGGSKQ